MPAQKALVTYDNILRLSDDPDGNDVIKFLRERKSFTSCGLTKLCSFFGRNSTKRMFTP